MASDGRDRISDLYHRALARAPEERAAFLAQGCDGDEAADGKFVIPTLPPGEYLMTAVTDIEPGEWFDPTLLENLSRSAIPLTIAEGEKKTQDLRLAAQLP